MEDALKRVTQMNCRPYYDAVEYGIMGQCLIRVGTAF